MAAHTNDWKLGLFVSLSAGVIFLSLAALGVSKLDETYVFFETYFDESVQGLDKGTAVKFRGAPIGTISDIGVAPDQKHVRLVFELQLSKLKALGVTPSPELELLMGTGGRYPGQYARWPKDFRVQLVSAGITGLKYLEINVFPNMPIPRFEFPLPENFAPPAPSTLKSVEASVIATLAEAPDIAKRLDRTLTLLEQRLKELPIADLSAAAQELLETGNRELTALDGRHLNETAVASLAELKATLEAARETFERLNRQGGAIEHLESTAANLDAQVAKLDLGKAVETVETASKQVGDAALAVGGAAESVSATTRGRQLDDTLRKVAQAADALRLLAEALERDSDMLLKGRSGGD